MPKVRDDILRLRKEGYSYLQIIQTLGCSKGAVSYHCSKLEGHEELCAQNRENQRMLLHIPSSQEPVLLWLLNAGIRKSDIADALDLKYQEVLLYAKRAKLFRVSQTDNYFRVKLRRKHLKMLAVALKGGQCELCGYHRSLQALDFHHLDPEKKDFNISAVANRSWKSVKTEIQKCQLLCTTCHRELEEILHGGQLTPTWIL